LSYRHKIAFGANSRGERPDFGGGIATLTLKTNRIKNCCTRLSDNGSIGSIVKDDRLLVRVHGRNFYLKRPRLGRPYFYLRLDAPSNSGLRVKSLNRSLKTNQLAAAKERAKLILEPILTGRWRDAEKLKARNDYATIGELLACYKACAKERPTTIRTNSSSLRLIVRTAHGGNPDEEHTTVLTGGLISRFEELRCRDIKDRQKLLRCRTTTRSYVVQGRAVVSPRKMKFYEGLNLPDLTSFRAESVEAPKRSNPRPLDKKAIEAINAAAPGLAESDPTVYVSHLLFSRLALRNIEQLHARWTWIVDGAIHIIDRPEENFYTKGAEGSVLIAPDVLRELLRFRDLSTDDYIVPGANMTERRDAIYRRHSAWARQWIKDRSKTSYELRRYAGSRIFDMGGTIMDVRDFLRHKDVQTTQRWYLSRLDGRTLPTIGMDELVSNDAKKRPPVR